jgi:signal transduction histidine kinase/ActR/RegA family two-component response regulator
MTEAARWRLPAIVGGLLVVLTFRLVRGATPDPVLHERTLQTVQALTLLDAALQRDALKARAGLLPHYDPLVGTVEGLRAAVATLRVTGGMAPGEAGADLRRHIDLVARTVALQEALVERLKSDNALLQNSLMYFAHASGELGAPVPGGEPQAAAVEAGTLANAMLRFLRDPGRDAAGNVTASLDRLAALPAAAGPPVDPNIRVLAAHGRMILATLPEVDDTLERLLAAPTTERVRALQATYLGHHAQAQARAAVFRLLLYAVSMALLAYLTFLFLRLRANTRALGERSSALQARLAFEALVTGISAEFVHRTPDGSGDTAIRQALERLGRHAEVDRAYVVAPGAEGERVEVTHRWERAGTGPPSVDGLRELLAATPPDRSVLEGQGIRSWLCLPMRCDGRQVGWLGFDAVRGEKRWSEDDVALLRTVGEIFANAIERRRAEAHRDALEARLRQAQKMEAIGTLAGGIAHDFNNILSAILGYGEMALAGLAEGGTPRRHVREMVHAGRRAAGIIDQILAFSRRADHERRPVRVQPLVEEAMGLLRALVPPTVAIRARLEAPDAVVLSEPSQLHRVVVNLGTNAAQAMPQGGALDVALETVRTTADRSLSSGPLAAGRYVRLTVTDTGHGMAEAVQRQVFNPFFTTRAAGGGTGLGLSTVYGIVTECGGAIEVRSAPGAGSRFEAYLAQAAEPAAAEGTAAPATAAPGGNGETILLVDDEEPLVRLGEEMLASLGYEPVGFGRATEALEAFQADPQRFDLVLTDEAMPGLTGVQLAAAVHRVRPELPVILITGHGGLAQTDRLRAAGIRAVLRKPVAAGDLAASIARHLRAPLEPAEPRPPRRDRPAATGRPGR